MAVLLAGNVLEAVFISRAFTWSGVRFGFSCSRSTAAPLTTGVAMLVPLNRIYEVEIVFVATVERVFFLLFLLLPPELVVVVVGVAYSLR